MELNVKLALDSQSYSQQITVINREMKVVQSSFAAASSALGNFGNEQQRLEAKSASLTRQIQMSQQKVDLLTAAHEKAKGVLATNAAANETLRQTLERATSAYNQSVTATGASSAESVRLKAALDALNTQYAASNTLILRNAASADNLNIRLQNTQAAQNRLQNELNTTNSDLEAQRESMDSAGESAEESSAKFKEFGEKLKEMGRVAAVGILAIGTAFIGMVTGGVKMADDLTRALNGVQASTGTTDTAMGDMRTTMLDIYNDNFGEGFEDIGSSLAVVTQQTGLSGDALKMMTEDALALRDTFGMEVGDSVKAANQLVQQFGVTGTEAYNLIAHGAQNGMDKNGDLLDIIGEYSVQFKNMGFSSDEMFNILSNGAKAGGFSIDVMGDAMKEFNIRSKDGSDATTAAFAALGLDANKLSIDFANGGEAGKAAFMQVNTALANSDDLMVQNQIGTALWGTMWEDLGPKAILSLGSTTGEINKSVDALKKINEVKYNTFGESIEGIKRQLLTGIVLPLGEEVLPEMNEFSNYLKQTMPAVIEGVKPVINGLLDTFKLLVDSLTIIIPVLAGVLAGFVAFNIISTVSALMEAYRLATAGVTIAQWALNAAMTANPMGIVVVAIAALVAAGVALWMNWDTIKVKLTELWAHITNAWSGISSGITAACDAVMRYMTAAWASISVGTSTTWNAITLFLTGIWSGISATVMTVWDGIISYLIAVWNSILDVATTVFESIKLFLDKIWSSINEGVTTMWTGIKNFFIGIWDVILNIFLGSLLLIMDLVSGNFGKMSTDAQGIWNNLKTAFGQIWLGIQQVFSGYLQAISGLLTLTWTTISTSLKTAWDAIKNYFDTLWVAITKAAVGAWEGLKTTVITITTTLIADIKSTWESILTWFTTLPARLKQYALDMFNSMRDGVTATVPAVKTSVVNGLEVAWDYIRALPSKALQWGGDIIQGLINGIGDKANALWDKAKSITNGIASSIRNTLDIQSPSQVMQTIGQYTVDGLVLGIGDKTPAVGTAMDNVAATIASKGAAFISAGNSIGKQFSEALQSSVKTPSTTSHSSGGGSSSNVKGVGTISNTGTVTTKSGTYNQATGNYSVTNLKTGETKTGSGSLKDYEKDYNKFHDGGWVGQISGLMNKLRSDEVPAILQSGEFVLSRKMLSSIAQGGIFNRPNTITNSGSAESAKVSEKPGAGIHQTVNIYSPTALTPSEVARQSRNAMRELALSF